MGERVYDRMLKEVYVVFYTKLMAEEVDDGVDGKLARPVVGDISTTIDFNEINILLLQSFGRHEKIGDISVLPKGIDGIVLSDKDYIFRNGEAFTTRIDTRNKGLLLHLEHLAIGDALR